jgi:hypothetical protein
MRYRVQFIRDFENISRGSIVRLPESEAISMVTNGYAVYYVM